jgi:hypothetical protein
MSYWQETKGSIVALSCVVTAPPLSTAVKHVAYQKQIIFYFGLLSV